MQINILICDFVTVIMSQLSSIDGRKFIPQKFTKHYIRINKLDLVHHEVIIDLFAVVDNYNHLSWQRYHLLRQQFERKLPCVFYLLLYIHFLFITVTNDLFVACDCVCVCIWVCVKIHVFYVTIIWSCALIGKHVFLFIEYTPNLEWFNHLSDFFLKLTIDFLCDTIYIAGEMTIHCIRTRNVQQKLL